MSDAQHYEIRVRGHLAPHWSARLARMTLVNQVIESEAITLIHGTLPDQAALYGVLCCLRDLGMTLISVHPGTGFALHENEEPV